MKRIAATAAAALIAVSVGLTTPGGAESETTVRVALTDLSAAMGTGPMGQMMMGPGYGWGPGMMGNGMTGPGYGSGPGMMGNGMMGPGYGWGPAMMGPYMMMGMMAIRIDHDTVKAGAVKFDVTNWSRGMLHEMLVVAVDNPTTQLPYNYAQAKVAEDQVKVVGDTSELPPNASRTLELTLGAGSYLLICNVPGHYAAGMAVPFRVTP